MITTAEDRIALVHDVYDAINKHDVALIEQLLSEDCVRHFPRGASPIAGDHVGRDRVLATYDYVIQLTGGDHRLDVGGVLASDQVVASYHHESAGRGPDSARLDTEMLVRWRIEGDRVAEIWDYANDIPQLNSFLS
ncbi:MAG: hypothetical protein JWO37_1952 [Acidimicrobiales bacterium]|nr:hypothetical protein [Acidimicrobiales bacterium]